jgi:hypothetical protein
MGLSSNKNEKLLALNSIAFMPISTRTSPWLWAGEAQLTSDELKNATARTAAAAPNRQKV